jgi:predicted permease
VNVSSLLMVRSESRRREIAIRSALGASTSRLIRQFATEGLLLATVSCSIGTASAIWVMKLLTNLIPRQMMLGMPYLRGLGLNLRVLAFAAGVWAFAALLFAAVPVIRLRIHDTRAGLAEGDRGYAGTLWRRFGSNLVVLELAIAVVLLSGAGLLARSFYALLHVGTGFQARQLAVMNVVAPDSGYPGPEKQIELERKILSRIGALPGVESCALTTRLPLTGNGNTWWIRFAGRPYDGEHNEVNAREVSSDYIKTLHARLLRGRDFTDNDDRSKPNVVMINRALEQRYFPDENPIGKKIGNTNLSPASMREIIGVVDDIREGSLDSEIWPAIYLPFNQNPDTDFSVVVRTSQEEKPLLPLIRQTIHEIDDRIATNSESTMTERMADSQTAYLHRSSAWLVGGFAAVALLLGVIGLYGVIAYSVSRRTREIGVRMALGAEPRSVCQLILKEAGILIGLGIAAGSGASLATGSMIRTLFFGVSSWDLPTLASVAIVLGTSAVMASYIPARRAASVNPVEALRAE